MTAFSNAGSLAPRKVVPPDLSPLIPDQLDVPANDDVKLSPDSVTRRRFIWRAPSAAPPVVPPVAPWQPPPKPPQNPSIWPSPQPFDVDPVETPPDSWPPLRTRNDAPTTSQQASMAQNLTVRALRMKGVPDADISAAIDNPARMNELLNRLYVRGATTTSGSDGNLPKPPTATSDAYLPFGWSGLAALLR